MLDIFGPHRYLVDDKDRRLGRVRPTGSKPPVVLAEEILSRQVISKSAEKMKSMITGETIQIERKYGSCRQVQERMKVIVNTRTTRRHRSWRPRSAGMSLMTSSNET